MQVWFLTVPEIAYFVANWCFLEIYPDCFYMNGRELKEITKSY